VSQQVYQMARAQGFSKEDGASIVKVYERMAGVTLGPRDELAAVIPGREDRPKADAREPGIQ
jgi:hypothetical protein